MDQKSFLHHRTEVLAPTVNGRPDGDDHLDSHGMQFVHHRFRIRPVGAVELPVSLVRPVEEIDHDLVDPDSFFLISPGDLQDLVLGAIAKLALPEPHQILGKSRGASGHGSIVRQNFLRRITRGDPVIHFLCGTGSPFGIIHSERCTAYCRIVPQKAIPKTGNRKGNADLGIPLFQIEQRTLEIQMRLLILAHPIEFLFVICVKPDCQTIV